MSNGHLALLADLLKFADLRVDALLSAQLADGYKPDAKVYLTALASSSASQARPGWWPPTPRTSRPPPRWAFARSSSTGRSMGAGRAAGDPPALAGLLEADALTDLAEALGC